MTEQRTTAIRDAAASRSQDTAARARRAVRELTKRGTEINFAAVAVAANVSRQFLYTNPELRQEIEQLRGERRTALSRTSVLERGSDASIRARLRAALDDNQRLRDENSRLRGELAVTHGRVRELELTRRAGRNAK